MAVTAEDLARKALASLGSPPEPDPDQGAKDLVARALSMAKSVPPNTAARPKSNETPQAKNAGNYASRQSTLVPGDEFANTSPLTAEQRKANAEFNRKRKEQQAKPAVKPAAKPTGTIRSRIGTIPLELPNNLAGQAVDLLNQAANANPLVGAPLAAITNVAGLGGRKQTAALERKWAAEDAAREKQAEADRKERERRTVGTIDPVTLRPVEKPKPQNVLQKAGGAVQRFINEQPVIGTIGGFGERVSDALYAAQKAGAAPANVRFAPEKSPQGQAERASVARLTPLVEAYQKKLEGEHYQRTTANLGLLAEPGMESVAGPGQERSYVAAGKAWNWQDFGAFLKSQGVEKLNPWEQKLLNTAITAKRIQWAMESAKDARLGAEITALVVGEIVGQGVAPFVVRGMNLPPVRNRLARAVLPNEANIGNTIANTLQEGVTAAGEEGATPQSVLQRAQAGAVTGYGATAGIGAAGVGVKALRGAKARAGLTKEAARLEAEFAASNPLTQPRAQSGTTAAQVAEAQGKLAALDGVSAKPTLPQAPAASAPGPVAQPLGVERGPGQRRLEIPEPAQAPAKPEFKSGDVVTVLKPDGTPRNKPGTVARRNADGTYVLSGEKAAVPAERVQPVAEAPATAPTSGPAVWRSTAGDRPVEVTGVAGEMNGRTYVNIEGSSTAIPLDEVEFSPKSEVPTKSVDAPNVPKVDENIGTSPAPPVVEAKAPAAEPPAPLPGEVRVTSEGGLAVKGKRPYTAEETDDILRLHEALGAEDAGARYTALMQELGAERGGKAVDRFGALQDAGRLDAAVKAHAEWRAAEEAARLAEVDKLRAEVEREALGEAEESASALSMRNTGSAKNRKTGRTVNYTNIERVPVEERQRLLDAALKKNPARGEYVYEGGAAGKGATVRDLVLDQGILPDDLGLRSRSGGAKVTVTQRTLDAGELLDKTPTRREVAAAQKAAAKAEFEAALNAYKPPSKLYSGVVPDPEFLQAVAQVVPVARAAVKYGHASAKELVEVLREAVGNHSDAFFKSVIDQLKKEDGDFEAPPAAKPAPEPKPIADPKRSTGLANQVQEREVIAGIIKAPEKGIPQSARTFQQLGKALVDEGQADPEALAREIATGRKGITANDFGVLLEGDRILKNAVNASRGKLDAAIKAGEDASFLRTQYEAAVAKRQAYLDDVQKGKTEWHNIGMALQAGADLDTGDFAEVIAEAARAKGAPLSPQSEAIFKKLTDDYNDAVTRADALEAELAAERARGARQADSEPSGGITEAPEKVRRMKRRERILTERKAIEDQIDSIIRAASRVNDLGSVVYESGRFAMAAGKLLINHLDEAALGTEEAIAKVIATFKAKGVELSRADLVREVAELTKPEERTKSEIQATKGKIISELRREAQLTQQIEALKRGEKTERNPAKQREKSARIAELEAERAGLLQDAKPKRAPKAKAPQEAGEPKQRPATEPKAKLTPEELKARSNARTVEKLKQEIADLKAGKTPEKTATAEKPSPEVVKLREERNLLLRGRSLAEDITRLERELAGVEAPRPATARKPTPAELADAVQRRSDLAKAIAKKKREAKTLAEMQRKLDVLNAGGRLPKKPKATLAPEVETKLDELTRARRLAAAQDALAELEEQLRSGNFRKPTPKELLMEQRLADARAKADLLRTEIRGRIGREKPKTFGEKALNVLQAPKSLLSSLDISAGGRQGWLLGVANPDLGAKAFAAQMQALKSPVAAQKLQNSILNRPNAPLYKQGGLYLSPLGSHSEEAFQGKLFQDWKRLNFIEASERAYSAYLNSIRADTFDRMVRSTGRSDPETLKAIANYVNIATGRGGGPQMAKAAELLNNVMFSPRFVASRFQYALGTPLVSGKGARAAIAKQYARTLMGLGSVIALAELAGADVEKDPRSSDFLKIRIGNTRTDLLGGIQQGIVLASRLATKQTKGVSGPGKVGQVKQAQPSNVAWRFLRSKASPVAGVAWTLIEEKNFVGEEYKRNDPKTYGKLALDLVAPLTARELVEAAVKDGVEAKDALMLLNILGFSTARYDDDDKAKPRPN